MINLGQQILFYSPFTYTAFSSLLLIPEQNNNIWTTVTRLL